MFDVIFLSYEEPNADRNYDLIKDRVFGLRRVHGVKGIHAAHRRAAEVARTRMFFVVDGDAEVFPEFDFSFRPPEQHMDMTYFWPAVNPVNDLVYGYGGVKLFNRERVLEAVSSARPDFSTSVTHDLHVFDQPACRTVFNTDAFAAWRAGFRECAKLASAVIPRQIEDETAERLAVWCSKGEGDFAEETLDGARRGRDFGIANRDNPEKLALINDFAWLRSMYDATADDQ